MAVGRYYRITPRFWQDSDVRNEWTEDMRLLALYLMTSPHRNMVGLYYCPLSYMENDLQWQSKRLRFAFDSLSNPPVDFCRYDEKSQVVFLTSGLKHDAPSNPQQVTGAVKVLHNIPATYLLHDLLSAADSLCPLLSREMRGGIDFESISNRLPYPVPRTPVSVETPMCVSPETHAEVSASLDEDKPTKPNDYPPEFESFWQAYPLLRRVVKRDAFAKWKARLKQHLDAERGGHKITPDMLVLAAENYSKECKRLRREADKIKHPATFLSGKHPFADYLQAPSKPAAPKPIEPDLPPKASAEELAEGMEFVKSALQQTLRVPSSRAEAAP